MRFSSSLSGASRFSSSHRNAASVEGLARPTSTVDVASIADYDVPGLQRRRNASRRRGRNSLGHLWREHTVARLRPARVADRASPAPEPVRVGGVAVRCLGGLRIRFPGQTAEVRSVHSQIPWSKSDVSEPASYGAQHQRSRHRDYKDVLATARDDGMLLLSRKGRYRLLLNDGAGPNLVPDSRSAASEERVGHRRQRFARN